MLETQDSADADDACPGCTVPADVRQVCAVYCTTDCGGASDMSRVA
jgi:hypothetical protein